MSDVTRILNAIEQGDEKATDELLPLLYEELVAFDLKFFIDGRSHKERADRLFSSYQLFNDFFKRHF